MGIDRHGFTFTCDACGERVKSDKDIVQDRWSRGHLSFEPKGCCGYVGPVIDLCPKCWPPNWSGEVKKTTLVGLIKKLYSKGRSE